MCIHPADGPAGLRVRRVAAVLAAAALATMFLDTVARAQGYPARFELGTTAAGQDIAPIDIAVPADGKGLPPGSGDYVKGKAVYDGWIAEHAEWRAAASHRRPRHARLQKPGAHGRKLLALCYDAVRLRAARDAVHDAGVAARRGGLRRVCLHPGGRQGHRE